MKILSDTFAVTFQSKSFSNFLYLRESENLENNIERNLIINLMIKKFVRKTILLNDEVCSRQSY